MTAADYMSQVACADLMLLLTDLEERESTDMLAGRESGGDDEGGQWLTVAWVVAVLLLDRQVSSTRERPSQLSIKRAGMEMGKHEHIRASTTSLRHCYHQVHHAVRAHQSSIMATSAACPCSSSTTPHRTPFDQSAVRCLLRSSSSSSSILVLMACSHASHAHSTLLPPTPGMLHTTI